MQVLLAQARPLLGALLAGDLVQFGDVHLLEVGDVQLAPLDALVLGVHLLVKVANDVLVLLGGGRRRGGRRRCRRLLNRRGRGRSGFGLGCGGGRRFYFGRRLGDRLLGGGRFGSGGFRGGLIGGFAVEHLDPLDGHLHGAFVIGLGAVFLGQQRRVHNDAGVPAAAPQQLRDDRLAVEVQLAGFRDGFSSGHVCSLSLCALRHGLGKMYSPASGFQTG